MEESLDYLDSTQLFSNQLKACVPNILAQTLCGAQLAAHIHSLLLL